MVPEVDSEVALRLVGQLPEITGFAKVALDDAERAYEATLASNERSLEIVHQVHLERLAILKGELDKELSPEERMRVLNDIRDVNSNSLHRDSKNKNFLSEQFDKKLGVALAAAGTVAAVVVAIMKSGSQTGRRRRSSP